MLVENTKVRSRLRTIVQNLVKVVALQEDLFQEALVHLWCIEEDQPNMTLSWYLSSCSFHVRHLLVHGRSIDSPKRRHLLTFIPLEPGEEPERTEIPDTSAGPFEQVSASDLLHEAVVRLNSIDQAILTLLADNRGVREIASSLGMSHVGVIKARSRIARMVAELTSFGL